jgi:predicted  nucleic acid-binding Zn-ribbon protein
MTEFWVKSFIELQDVDIRIKDLTIRLEILPKEMKSLIAKKDQLLASTQQAISNVKKLELAIKTKESEIAELNAKNDKLQQQSVMVKKNNEYQALLGEIALNKKKASEIETQVIALMDKLEPARVLAVQTKSANDARIKTAKEEFDELYAFGNQLKGEIAKLKESRKPLMKNIPISYLTRYNSLLANIKESHPIAPLNEDGICGACFMKVTLQTSSSLAKNGIAICDNCQCYLYDPKEIEE